MDPRLNSPTRCDAWSICQLSWLSFDCSRHPGSFGAWSSGVGSVGTTLDLGLRFRVGDLRASEKKGALSLRVLLVRTPEQIRYAF